MSETELKFLVDETTSGEVWARVKALKLASSSPKTRTLRTIYLDTSEHALRKARIALRLRRDGRRWIQTVKTGGQLHGGLSQVGEVENPAPGGQLCLDAIPDGKDFFPYRPAHLNASPPRMSLARITNMAQDILGSGDYDGAIWTQGSPRVEETCYWLSLALDVTVPVCCNASQRYHGQISNDGPKNLADSTDWIASKVWADEQGRNRVGVVMVQDQRVFAAREVTKVDARPGGYVAAGGHGGILGAGGGGTGSVLRYVPAMKHTWQSEVNVSKLPASVTGIRDGAGGIETIEIAVKDGDGRLLDTAIPKVSIVKDASYIEDDYDSDPAQEVDTIAFMDYKLKNAPLSGFVLEGLNPYGKAAATSKSRILLKAVYSGFPVANVGRGTTEGFAISGGPFIAGSNLTSVKARILLMLCIMKFGMLPPAKDPLKPTKDEVAATAEKLALYQAVFDTH